MPDLVVLHRDKEISRLRFGDWPVTIGRHTANDVVIDNVKASRRHARIYRRGEQFIYEDCGSSNGSFVHEAQVKSHVLQDHDEIRVTDHCLVFLENVPEVEPSAPTVPDPWTFSLQGRTELGMNLEMFHSRFGDGDGEREADAQGARRLQALFEISQILEGTTELGALLAEILDKALNIMGGERGFIMLVDDKGELQTKVARDLDGEITGFERETISHSLLRKVIDSRRPILVHEAQSETWATDSVITHSIHSAICAPLLTRDTVTGAIYIDHRQRPHAFNSHDLAFFTTFALQAKAAIDSSRSYWELVDSLFQASGDFVVVCDPDGRLMQANRAAARLLKTTAEALANQRLVDLINPEDRTAASRMIRETLAHGVGPGCELRLSAGSVPLSVSSFTLRDRQGQAVGVCLIGRDLSEIIDLIGRLTRVNAFIRRTFGRYLSDEVVANLLDSPDHLELGGEKRKVTILMSDLRGFTSLSEQLLPEQVVQVLNNYLGTMVEVITRHRGTIDEFIGDAILVVFGAPISRSDDARRAVACALDMQLAIERVNAINQDAGLPAIEMGIAVHTGEVVVGNIGSERRSKYAVVGANVNVVARIESNTLGGQVLISQSTAEEAGDDLRLGHCVSLNAKGIRDPITVHDLLGLGGRYDLHLPQNEDELIDLPTPVPVRFAELIGKNVSDDLFEATVVRLGARHAELSTDREVEPLTNLKLALSGGHQQELYAKVIEPIDGAEEMAIRFTSADADVRIFVEQLRGVMGEVPDDAPDWSENEE